VSLAGSWLTRARCIGFEEEMHLVAYGHVEQKKDGAHDEGACATCWAVGTCWSCPVRVQCLRFTMAAEGKGPTGGRSGVAGGFTPYQRWRLYDRARLAGGYEEPIWTEGRDGEIGRTFKPRGRPRTSAEKDAAKARRQDRLAYRRQRDRVLKDPLDSTHADKVTSDS
jgi:hypothetical protein